MSGPARNAWRGRLRAAPLVLALGLAGCGFGGGNGGVDAAALPRLVLKDGDLPRVFVSFDEGRQTSAEAGDPQRFGRQGGWKARYRRPGTLTTRGPLIIDSRADVFESSDGASRELDALRARVDDVLPGAERLNTPPIGDDVIAATHLEQGADRRVRFYFVAWRDDNVTARLLVNGFDGRLTYEQVLALARKQQQRIARETAS